MIGFSGVKIEGALADEAKETVIEMGTRIELFKSDRFT